MQYDGHARVSRSCGALLRCLSLLRCHFAGKMVLMRQLPLTLLHESIILARSLIIPPLLQAAQQDATADNANNLLLVR